MTIPKILLILPFFLFASCDKKPEENSQPATKPETSAADPAPAPAAAPSKGPDVTAISKMVDDPKAARTSFDADSANYAWEAFIRLNVPLTGPDPKYWETWRQTSTVYLPNGAKPAPWGTGAPIPAEVSGQAKQIPDWPASAIYHNLDSMIQVDGNVLLDNWKQDVRYQLLMNRPTFDYILDRQFYNVNGQEAAAMANDPADFPPTAWELKTSYIWIGTNQAIYDALSPTYYIVPAYYEVFDNNGAHEGWETGWAALTGMHIINKTVANWVWITFENVNNAKFTKATIELGIPEDAAAANRRYQPQLAAIGSIFANYELVGVQTAFTDSSGKPTLLANSQIESAFQPVSSCITCHDVASIKPDGEYFNIVNPEGGGVNYYVGDPPDVTAQGYTRLDFVWSMKRASRASE